MLDITIWRGPRWARTGLLDYRHFRKPTNIKCLLNPTSLHPPFVAKNWPRAYASRLLQRSHSNINKIDSYNHFKLELEKSTSKEYAQHRLSTAVKKAPSPQVDSRIVLKFTADMIGSGVQSVLHDLCQKFRDLSHVVGIAWSLGGQHLQHRIRKFNLQEHERCNYYRILEPKRRRQG